MKHRECALLLVGSLGLAMSLAAADGGPGCLASRGREGALSTFGGRTFATESGHARETSVTSHCMGCHDGTVSRSVLHGSMASSPASSLLQSEAFAGPASGGTHPVDVAYPAGRSGFRPVSEVELSIPLVGGRVTCESCHSGDERTPSRLTVTIELSKLCTTCHEK